MNDSSAPTANGSPALWSRRGKQHLRAARLVWLVHIGIVITVLTGWMLPYPLVWAVVAVLCPTMQLLWWLNNDVCVLTSLECWLRGEPAAGSPEQGSFVGRLLERSFGPVTEETVSRVSNGVNFFAFAASVLRLIQHAS